MRFLDEDFIWNQNELIWQSQDNRFSLQRFNPIPNNFIFVDSLHEQYLIFLAENSTDAIGVAEDLANVLNGR